MEQSKHTLHNAAEEGNLEEVNRLIGEQQDDGDRKIFVNAKDISAYTALHLAARYGHTKVIGEQEIEQPPSLVSESSNALV